MSRKVILYIATSLDGYIAKPSDNLDFLSIVQKEGEDYGYEAFVNTVDTVIMGRKTYDWVMKQVTTFPHSDKESYIITHEMKPAIGKTVFYNDSLKDLVLELKTKEGKNIFVDGGAEIVHELLKHHLIDEYIISIIPILVGSGKKLFIDGRPEQLLELISVKPFDTGLVQLNYKSKSG